MSVEPFARYERHQQSTAYQHQKPKYGAHIRSLAELKLSEYNSRTTEQDEEDREEVSLATGHHNLMNDSRDGEHKVLGGERALVVEGESDGILIYVIVEELVDHNVPFAVVARKVLHIPPVFIEEAVSKTSQFSEQIEPRV